MRRAAGIVATTTVLGLAGAADVSAVPLPGPWSDGDIALVGNRVLQAQPGPTGAVRIVSTGTTGRTVLVRLPRSVGGGGATFDASSTRVAFFTARSSNPAQGGPPIDLATWSGPPTGPLARSSYRSPCGGPPLSVSVTDDVAVFGGANCGQILIDVAGQPALPVETGGDAPNAVASAPGTVAWAGDDELVVARPDGTVLLRTPLPAESSDGLAVDADGRVAVTLYPGGDRGCTVYTASPAEPALRPLAVRACDSDLRIAGGRLYFGTPRGEGRALVSTTFDGTGERVHATLRGAGGTSEFDVADGRAAVARPGCRGLRVDLVTLTGPALAAVRCPISVVPGQRLTPRRSGAHDRAVSADVRLRCRAGCPEGGSSFGKLDRFPGTAGAPVGGYIRRTGATTGIVRVLLTDAQLARLRKDGPVRSRLRVQTDQGDTASGLVTIARPPKGLRNG